MTQREGSEAGLSITEMFGRVSDPHNALDTMARQSPPQDGIARLHT